MLEQAGQDASEAFDEIGHSDEAKGLLTKMVVGQMSQEVLSILKSLILNRKRSQSRLHQRFFHLQLLAPCKLPVPG